MAVATNSCADPRKRPVLQGKGFRLREARHGGPDSGRIAIVRLEQQPLEIRRDLDVHGRRGCRLHALDFVRAGGEGPGQDVVGVGGDHQPLDRKAHALGDEARQDIAEIARRHGERDAPVRCSQGDRRGKIIHHLGGDPRPVDGIDPRQVQFVAKASMVEHALHHRLAIVEGALDCERVDIRGGHGGHLPPLHVRYAAMGVKDEDIDLIEALEGFHRGAAGIARGCADDRGPRAARPQDIIHQPSEQLHRHVLERQRRAVKKFEDEEIVVELDEGADGRMPEARIGLVDHAIKVGLRNVAIDKRRQHGLRDIRVRFARKTADRFSRQGRPALGQIEAAIPRQTGKQGVGKAERGGFTPGRDMEHVRSPDFCGTL